MQRTIAIAGLGAAARTIHLPACARQADLRIVGGCDPAVRSGEFPFPVFADNQEMLDRTRPDILAVLTPPDSHYALARMALQAGCHVFCEKPFVSTLEEAADICRLAESSDRRVVVNNQYRFMNIHREAKRRIGSPDFGDLLFVSVHQTVFDPPRMQTGWRGQDAGHTCREFGTHVLDLCRFFFGEDPISINARMPKPGSPDGRDYLDLIQLEFSGDRVAHITLDRLSRGTRRYLSMRLDGTAGCMETHLGGGVALTAGVHGGSWRPYVRLDLSPGGRAHLIHDRWPRKIASDPLDLFARATGRLLAAFLEALDSDTLPPCSAQDNRRTLALMLAAYESEARRASIPMTY